MCINWKRIVFCRYELTSEYAIFINGGHAKKQWDRVHASEAYEALLHCFPLFSCLISLACMHLVPLFYACPPFMNMVYWTILNAEKLF